MFPKKIKKLKNNKKKSLFDLTLWVVENYLPQKNNINSNRQMHLYNIESSTIKVIQKLAFLRSRSITPMPRNRKVSFTIGNWALPYLNFLRQIGLLK